MLIQFSVENFKSIREEQTLSMVKAVGNKMSNNYYNPHAPSVPELLKTAVIYGANASGKSNLLKAIFQMVSILKSSFNKELDEDIDVTPFLFNPTSKCEPTTFNISIVINLLDENVIKPTLVEYGFSADGKQVYEEWLSVYPKGREQSWFHRIYDEKEAQYSWSESSFFKGQKSTWKENTRSDQLFLSTAVHLNSKQLKPIYDALVENIVIISNDRIGDNYTKDFCKFDEKGKNLVLALMQHADVDVDDIVIKKPKIKSINFPKGMPLDIQKRLTEQLHKQEKVYFIHIDNEGNEIEIMLEEESDGTQKVFEFSSLILISLMKGGMLVIDEFNKSLHPDLVRFLVKLFNSDQNTANGQLVFTTHETSILRRDLLRRDQIWFCEKNKNKTTNLFSLSKFTSRDDGREDVEEYYLHGRYGAKPIISDFIFHNTTDGSLEEVSKL